MSRRTTRGSVVSHRRYLGAAVGVLTLGLAVSMSGCGKAETRTAPTESPTPSASASVTASPTPSATATPTSRFENRTEVKAARAWAEAYARDINAGDKSLPHLTPLLNKRGRGIHLKYLMPDELGKVTYPGPAPFTPLQIVRKGDRRGVGMCLMTSGWGLDKQTNQPAQKRKVLPFVLLFKAEKDQLKVTNAVLNLKDKRCSHTKVKGYPWA